MTKTPENGTLWERTLNVKPRGNHELLPPLV